MPILKPGQSLGQNETAPELQGVTLNTNSTQFQERLLAKFKPQEYVEIKNIDDSPLYWQYMPQENETETTDETGRMHQTYRTDPELWGLRPGESEFMIGACAYRALDVLYKNVAAKRALKTLKDPNDPRKAKDGSYTQVSFNFSDAGIQEEVVKQAYLGKATPTFGRPSVEASAPTAQPEVQAPALGDKQWPVPSTTPVAKATANATAGK